MREIVIGLDYFNLDENSQSTWCEKGCPVIIFVSYDTYDQLESKITRFASDISADISAPVYVELFALGDKPKNLRKKIIDLNNQRNVQGVILFDAPILLTSFVAPGGGTELGAYDSCYTDLIYDYNFIRTSKGYICKFNNLKSGSTTSVHMWYSRLLPPGENKIEQLSDYLDRNHAYRTGALDFNRGSLVYSDQEFVLGSDNPHSLLLYFGGKDTLYTDSQIKVIQTTSNNQNKNAYLNELKKSYELVIVNQHGCPTGHFYDIKADEIKSTKPDALGYLFYSCSVGAFQEDDYLAGRYLFSGNGLVAIAHSTPVLTSVGADGPVRGVEDVTSYKLLNLLNHGANFGEAWLFSYGAISGSLLGDPTIRLREKRFVTIELSQSKVQLDSIGIITEVTIFNHGSKDVKIMAHPFTLNHPYDTDLVELEAETPGIIPQGLSDNIKLAIEAKNGNFDGRLPLIFVGDEGYSIKFLEISG